MKEQIGDLQKNIDTSTVTSGLSKKAAKLRAAKNLQRDFETFSHDNAYTPSA
jgi:hypothetical protein